MRIEPKVAQDLIRFVAQHGLEPFLVSTRVLVALLDGQGKPVSSNPAFDALRRTLPDAVTLKELFSSASSAELDRLFQAGENSRGKTRIQLEAQHGKYDCLFIPLSDGRFLFFGEPDFDTGDSPGERERLEGELQRTRLALEIKQKELEAVLAQADEVAHTDALTFLPNRRLIIGDLQRQVTYSERYGTPLTVSMLDLDHFKLVNDTYGHSTGDQVLRFIATELRDHIRQPDEVGRYGGEEFLIILPNSTVKAASEQAARLCQQIRSVPIASGVNVIHMTVSIGIAQYKLHEEGWEELLNRADQALYQAKRNGRDQWVIWES